MCKCKELQIELDIYKSLEKDLESEITILKNKVKSLESLGLFGLIKKRYLTKKISQ
ncbi:hypothetical protein [Flavobacterium phage FL-1]|nr:hypothetical protein [Flavobacterium phage FL-1]